MKQPNSLMLFVSIQLNKYLQIFDYYYLMYNAETGLLLGLS